MLRMVMAGLLAATPALADTCDQLDAVAAGVGYQIADGRVVDSLTYSDDMAALNRKVALLAKCLADNRRLTTELFELAKQDAELRRLEAKRH